MSFGIFQRILAALRELGMSPEQLAAHLEYMATLDNKKKTEQ